MKNFVKFIVVGVGMAGLALACEPGPGDSDAETTGTTNGTDNGTTPPPDESYPSLELFDDSGNETLNPCDAGALKTPGADIDAAELDTGGTIAQLTQCSGPSGVGSCTNDMNNATLAEGEPNGDKEHGFVSLNGGFIRCNWDSGASAKKGTGQVLTIYEIGGAGGGIVETFYARVCKGTAGNCIKDAARGAGTSTGPVDSLF